MIAAPALGFVGRGCWRWLGVRLRWEGPALAGSALSALGIIATVGLSMFPFILPSTIDAAFQPDWSGTPRRAQQTLLLMLIATVDLPADRAALHGLGLSGAVGPRDQRRRSLPTTTSTEETATMWYFTWVLGLGLAVAFGVLNGIWHEFGLPAEDDGRAGRGRRQSAALLSEQDEVVAFLSDARRSAHRSKWWRRMPRLVFLAGERSFKLKRAVRYSYLDYSTEPRRRAACEAEHALNRRFAPGLYLGVQAITRDPDGRLQLGGEGLPVDWVVEMRRFRQADQFDELAAQGRLTPELMRSLADSIAGLHGAAGRQDAAGGAGGIGRAIETTIENLGPDAGAALPADAVGRWATQARAALGAQAGLLERRRLAGKVRACHGDLHLRNICLLEGKPTPFDAIEFNPDLSSIDVLYDLAFLLMDLHGRGLDRLGNVLFNRYLDLADEADGLAALPLFLSLRAAIRAQVAAAAQQRTKDAGKARDFAAEAARYLALACALLEEQAAACLVAVGGQSGTGKSTLAYRLAPALGRPPGARVLRTDVLRKRAAGVALESRLPDAAYTMEQHAATYRRLEDEARSCLAAGHAVVADAVFAAEAERAGIRQVAREAGVAFRGLWLVAALEVLLRRVAARAQDASDATAEVVRAQAARPGTPPDDWATIDAGEDGEAVARQALTGLGTLAITR